MLGVPDTFQAYIILMSNTSWMNSFDSLVYADAYI
jgi:hypothetical protein